MDERELYIALTNKRREMLKFYRDLTRQFLAENKKAQLEKRHEWATDVLTNNVRQLTRYQAEIKAIAEKDNVELFVKFQIQLINHVKSINTIDRALDFIFNNLRESIFQFEIARFSFQYSVVYDLYWVGDGMIADHFNIAAGKQGIERIADSYPSVIEKLRAKVIPYFKSRTFFARGGALLEEICDNSERLSKLSVNIQLHALIEHLVRVFAKWVYAKQHPGLTEKEIKKFIDKFSSLESLIKKAQWPNDLEIRFSEALVMGKYISDPQLEQAAIRAEKHMAAKKMIYQLADDVSRYTSQITEVGEEAKAWIEEKLTSMKTLMPELIDIENDKVLVSLSVELQFLLRRYKENRNSVIHGNFEEFDAKWNCYVNLSAVRMLHKVIRKYEMIYPI